MKTVVPWLVILVLAAGLFFVFQQGQHKDSELVDLKKQVGELTALKTEVEELRQSAVSPQEVARLRKESSEVYQLRSKVSQLQKDLSVKASQVRSSPRDASSAEAAYANTGVLTPGQLQQVIRENQQLRSEVAEFQMLIQREQAKKQAAATAEPLHICINNLRQLDGATEQWAIENKKAVGDLVTANDVTPYLKKYPQCPMGGIYSQGPVGTAPTCNISGHVLPQ